MSMSMHPSDDVEKEKVTSKDSSQNFSLTYRSPMELICRSSCSPEATGLPRITPNCALRLVCRWLPLIIALASPKMRCTSNTSMLCTSRTDCFTVKMNGNIFYREKWGKLQQVISAHDLCLTRCELLHCFGILIRSGGLRQRAHARG